MRKSQPRGRAPAQAERAQLSVEYRQTTALKAYDRNARVHDQAQVRQIRASIDEFGFNNPILLKDDGETIGAGHGRWAAAQLDPPLAEVPTITLTGLTEKQWRAYVIADNKLALNATWDEDLLRMEVSELLEVDIGADLMGFDERELRLLMEGGATRPNSGALAERFLGVPFSVLSAREGWWRERKRAWISLGLRSELGRGEVMSSLASARRAQRTGMANAPDDGAWVTSSIFDPVLCELAYRWFCPPAGQVLDPFAGGSVRGVVASWLGRAYHGIDLRAEQVQANEAQAAEILGESRAAPVWRCGDSLVELDDASTPAADFVFSCPPYADLEVYSDDVRDLSTMDYPAFVDAYRTIIAKDAAALKPDRFACFVVGDIRDRAGFYRDFTGETVQAFRDAGLQLYNEAILVTAIGSLPVRAGRLFASTRKLGKTHQNILVFVKGDPRRATEACGDVEVGEVEADQADEDLADAA